MTSRPPLQRANRLRGFLDGHTVEGDEEDNRLQRVWRIAQVSNADPRWYWELRNHSGAILRQSHHMFDQLRECLADAERAGFSGRVRTAAKRCA